MPNLDLNILQIMHGDTPVSKIMKGDTQIWPEFTLLNYISNTGNAFIDTGFKANNNTVIEFQYLATATNYYAFGARTARYDKTFLYYVPNTSSIRWSYGTSEVTPANTGVSNNTVVTTANTSKNVLTSKYGSTTRTATATANTFQCDYNMYLFNCNMAGEIPSLGLKGRVYYCKIYDNGTLIRNYVPVLQNSTGLYGLLDKVNNKFYTSSNGDSFSGG